MLLPEKIPSVEPQIKVGIVLPEDQQTELELEFPDPKLYAVRPGKSNIKGNKLRITINQKDLQIGRLRLHKIAVKRLASPNNLDNPLLVKNVIAGRGFHWKKAVNMSLPGDLQIRVVDGCILLINILPLEQYLMCVATSEMSAACPESLIRAQTIVARSWMLANIEQKHRALGFDVCNDDCCQRYHGTGQLTPHAVTGAQSTRGQVIMFGEKICDARYSKSCGGMMETYENVWDGPPLPYMQNIFDAGTSFHWPHLPLSEEENLRKWVNASPACFCSSQVVSEETLTDYIGTVDEQGSYFRWNFHFSQTEMTDLLNEKLGLEARAILEIIPVKRGGSGRLTQVSVNYLDQENNQQSCTIVSEYEIRRVFHPSFLYSSAFYIEQLDPEEEQPAKFILRGAGWGHGAGLCQIGALGMARKGYSTLTMLKHYYPGCRLVHIYS